MYLVNGRTFRADEPALQEALAAAYDRHARPRCLCSSTSVPVYIAKTSEAWLLKRMPLTGHLHDSGCRHHQQPEIESPIATTRPAIHEDPVTGWVRIRGDFALSNRCAPARSLPVVAEGSSIRNVDPRLGLRGLVLYLWQRAELTVWRQAFAGKRSWAVVRHHLLHAASNVAVNGMPLAKSLFVPETFSIAKAEEIRARRLECFANGFGDRSSPLKRMLLIGEVKDIMSAPPQSHVVVKHLPDTSLVLRNVSDRWHADRYLRRIIDPSVHLVLAATFSLPHVTRPIIEDFCLVPMSTEWLPVDVGPGHQEALR